MADTTERKLVPYVGGVYDSARWAGFDPRPDDIIITRRPSAARRGRR